MSFPQLPPREEWGSKTWYVMRVFAIGLGPQPDLELQTEACNFFKSLAYLLPCEECRQHYRTLLQEYPVNNQVSSDKKCLAWVELVQKKINEKIAEDEQKEKQAMTETYVEKKHVQITIQPQRQRQRQIQSKPTQTPIFKTSKGLLTKYGTPHPSTATSAQQRRSFELLEISSKHYKRPCSC